MLLVLVPSIATVESSPAIDPWIIMSRLRDFSPLPGVRNDITESNLLMHVISSEARNPYDVACAGSISKLECSLLMSC